MSGIISQFFNLLVGTEPITHKPKAHTHVQPPAMSVEKTQKPSRRPFRKLTERELIQLESDIGAQLFGEVPQDHRREFFNLDLSTWIWYDEWVDAVSGQRKNMTIRYEIHDNGILKVQEGARYDFIEGQELENFMAAIHLYYERVARELYHAEPAHHHTVRAHAA